jgi:hypothetical protein
MLRCEVPGYTYHQTSSQHSSDVILMVSRGRQCTMDQRYEQKDTRGVDRLGQRTIQLWTIDQGNPFSMGFEERLETGKIFDGKHTQLSPNTRRRDDWLAPAITPAAARVLPRQPYLNRNGDTSRVSHDDRARRCHDTAYSKHFHLQHRFQFTRSWTIGPSGYKMI